MYVRDATLGVVKEIDSTMDALVAYLNELGAEHEPPFNVTAAEVLLVSLDPYGGWYFDAAGQRVAYVVWPEFVPSTPDEPPVADGELPPAKLRPIERPPG